MASLLIDSKFSSLFNDFIVFSLVMSFSQIIMALIILGFLKSISFFLSDFLTIFILLKLFHIIESIYCTTPFLVFSSSQKPSNIFCIALYVSLKEFSALLSLVKLPKDPKVSQTLLIIHSIAKPIHHSGLNTDCNFSHKTNLIVSLSAEDNHFTSKLLVSTFSSI
jgi:hypothetical protein